MSREAAGRGKGVTRTLVAIYSCICYLFDSGCLQPLFYNPTPNLAYFVCYLFAIYFAIYSTDLYFV